jgi:hypothetical protein
MKKVLAAIAVVFTFCSVYGQDFNTMAGDWIRVKAEYNDGGKLPGNHGSRTFLRYHFTEKEIYLVSPGNTFPSTYTRTGSSLKIAPVQTFVIEEYTDKALTLLEAEENRPIRSYFIRTDSFQVSGALKYPYEVIGADTVYSSLPGIEPIYPKGHNEFMKPLMMAFTQKVGFDFSYVVQKDGTIGAVTINASSNPKLDKRLIQQIRKSGKWIPATYKGKPIHVRQTGKVAFNNVGKIQQN